MKPVFPILAVVFLAAAAQAAELPGETANGKKLHAVRCAACHDDGVYTRKNRRITSLEALAKQVSACGRMADITLGKSQIDDLVKYLNETYYKFK